MKNFPGILREMKDRLNAESAHLSVTFPYFIEKEAPVTRTESFLEYACGFEGSLDGTDRMKEFTVSVSVPINTLLPVFQRDQRMRRPQSERHYKGERAVQEILLD